MLRRLQQQIDATIAARVRVVEADMRSFDLGERFDVIHCAANTFQHMLTTEDQLAVLRCVEKHLSSAGVFVAKLSSVASVDWGASDGALRLRQTRIDPETGERVMRFDGARADANRLVLHRTMIYDRTLNDGNVRRRAADVSLRYVTPSEMALLLEQAGLRLAQVYGDYDLSPFEEDSDSMIAVAERAP